MQTLTLDTRTDLKIAIPAGWNLWPGGVVEVLREGLLPEGLLPGGAPNPVADALRTLPGCTDKDIMMAALVDISLALGVRVDILAPLAVIPSMLVVAFAATMPPQVQTVVRRDPIWFIFPNGLDEADSGRSWKGCNRAAFSEFVQGVKHLLLGQFGEAVKSLTSNRGYWDFRRPLDRILVERVTASNIKLAVDFAEASLQASAEAEAKEARRWLSPGWYRPGVGE